MNELDAPSPTPPAPPLPHIETYGVGWARVRLSKRLGLAAVASAGGALVANAVTSAFGWYGFGQLSGSVLLLATVVMLLISFIIWFSRASYPGAVTFDALGLNVLRGGVMRRVERSQVASAYVVARYVRGGFAPTVEMELEGGDLVSFEVPSEELAHRIVDDLGFGRGKKRVHIGLGSPARRLYHLLLGIVAYYAGSFVAIPMVLLHGSLGRATGLWGLVSAAAMVGTYFLLRSLLRAPEVTIGDDGVFYRAGRKRRFLPGGAITGVEQSSVALPLLLRSMTEKTIAIHGTALDLERRGAVARLAYERFIAPVASADQGASQFARGGRTLAAWRDHLRTRLGDVGYRESARPVDVATAVLRSPRSSNDERVGAALALRVAGEPQERIRIAASAAADDDLRVALETIAEVDDDVAIDRVLRKLR